MDKLTKESFQKLIEAVGNKGYNAYKPCFTVKQWEYIEEKRVRGIRCGIGINQ